MAATANRFPSTGPIASGGDNFPTRTNQSFRSLSPRLITWGLPVLRSNSVTRSLISLDYDTYGAMRGETVDIPIPPLYAVSDVNPDSQPEDSQGSDVGHVSVSLDCWKQVPFKITDRERRQLNEDTFYRMAAGAAIAALADQIDRDILTNYRDVYSIVGQQGDGSTGDPFLPQTGDNDFIDPFPANDFAGIYAAVEAGRVLNDTLCPARDRVFLGNSAAEARTMYLRQFTDVSWNGAKDGIEEARPGRKYGFDFHLNQQMPVHRRGATPGGTGNDLNTYMIAQDADVGDTSVQLTLVANSAGTASPPVHGDIFYLGDDTRNTYVVTADGPASLGDAVVSGTNKTGNISISPPLRSAIDASADSPAVTFVPDHTVNLAFHPNAMTFITRPLDDPEVKSGNLILGATDPLSGITLRLEAERQNKQTRFSYDVLYGSGLIRPELICRVAGAA